MSRSRVLSIAAKAKHRFAPIRDGEPSPLAGGLINDSFLVRAGGKQYVLQRVSDIFDRRINDTIAVVTAHLSARGLETPRLIPADDGQAFADLGAGGIWRLLTFVEGRSFHVVQDVGQARSAGRLVARFHRALDTLEHSFEGGRAGVHDTDAHLGRLQNAVASSPHHPFRDEVARLADEILEAVAGMPRFEGLASRPCHGDLKFNNIVFRPDGGGGHRAVCLVDLDTLAPMPIHFEMGDAWRSWCNTSGEDVVQAGFDLGVFAASLEGYAGVGPVPWTDEEREALVHSVEWISAELSARFAADTLNETYFRWDPERFSSAAEHNWWRARGQWSLYQSARRLRGERRGLIEKVA